LLALLLLSVLAACQPVGRLPGLPPLALASGPKPLIVLSGSLRVVGPKGYCPDPATLTETEDSAVVFLGRCAAGNGVRPAVVTVTAGVAGSGVAMASGGESLAGFFITDAGRATLARSGRESDVMLGTALADKGVFLMRIDDRAVGTYWRGMLEVGGRLVSISATGPDLPPPDGRALVEGTAAALRRANPRN